MKTFNAVVLGLLVLFSIISGFTKIMLTSSDVTLYGGVGFTETEIIFFGVFYLLGGSLLVFETTRKWAAIFMSFVFCITGAVIFMSGDFSAGYAAMLPLFMIFFVLKDAFTAKKPDDEASTQIGAQ